MKLDIDLPLRSTFVIQVLGARVSDTVVGLTMNMISGSGRKQINVEKE